MRCGDCGHSVLDEHLKNDLAIDALKHRLEPRGEVREMFDTNVELHVKGCSNNKGKR
jgi:hypothetical protein